MESASKNHSSSREVEEHFSSIRNEIETLQVYFKDKVAECLADSQLAGADQLALAKEHMEEIDGLTKAAKFVQAAEQRIYIAQAKLFGDASAQSANQEGLRSLTCLVTEGLKKMSAISLVAALRKGVIRKDERFHVSLTNGVSFETTLDPVTGRFRERGKIAEFYRLEGVEPPVDVYLEETAKGKWLLFSANSTAFEERSEKLLRELEQALEDREPDKNSPRPRSTEGGVNAPFRIRIDWAARNPQWPSETLEASTAAEAWIRFVETLLDREGRALLTRLSATRLSGRGPVLTQNPARDYRHGTAGKVYANHELSSQPGYFVLTHSDTNEKLRWIAELMKIVGLPPKSVAVGFSK